MSKSIPEKKRYIVYNKFNGRCAYCGVKIKYDKMHVDHIVPFYRKWSQLELDKYGLIKGTGKINNLNPSCPSCNISKSTFTIEKWRQELKCKIDRVRRDSTNFRILESFNLIKITNKEVIFYFEKKLKVDGEQ